MMYVILGGLSILVIFVGFCIWILLQIHDGVENQYDKHKREFKDIVDEKD